MKVITHGGISVISAFSDGIGSAIGIDLPMEIELLESQRRNSIAVEKTLDYLNRRYGSNYHPYVRIRSNIPRSTGLKSSSALTLAIVLGYLNSFDLDMADAATLAAVCSRENGTSITGALDDISCALYGGVTLTDNRLDRIILRHPVKERPILICYPKYERRTTSKIDISSIKRAGPSIKPLRALVEGGFYYEAMALNGLIHGNIFGYDHDVLSYLLQSGSVYASISGKGPAMFAVYDKQDLRDDALRDFPGKRYELVATRFSNAAAKVEP